MCLQGRLHVQGFFLCTAENVIVTSHLSPQVWLNHCIQQYFADSLFLYHCIFGLHLSFEEKKKRCHTLVLHIWFALGKLCSQLLCASEDFRVIGLRMQKKGCLFTLSVLVFAGKC